MLVDPVKVTVCPPVDVVLNAEFFAGNILATPLVLPVTPAAVFTLRLTPVPDADAVTKVPCGEGVDCEYTLDETSK
jgi:hypothetical protein